MTKFWSKMVVKDNENDYLRLDHIKMNVVLWGCVQEMQKEIVHLKSETTKPTCEGKGEGK